MGSLMNWFFVLTVISIGTTFFISLLNDDVNTDLTTQNDNDQTIVSDYIKSGTLTIYEKTFFGGRGSQIAQLEVTNTVDDDSFVLNEPTGSTDSYLQFFMNKQGINIQLDQEVINTYELELQITNQEDEVINDEFDLRVQQNMINQENTIKQELIGKGLVDVIFESTLITSTGQSQNLDIIYSEVYPQGNFFTNIGSSVGDNFLGNLLTGLGGMPVWFNTVFAIITSMTIALGVLVTRGAN